MSQLSCNIRFTDVYFRVVDPSAIHHPHSYNIEVAQHTKQAFNLSLALLDFDSWHTGDLVTLTEKDCALLNLPFNPRETTTFTYQVEIVKDGKLIKTSRKEFSLLTSDTYH